MSNQNLESLAVYIPMDRRLAMQDGAAIDGEIVGTALFADISGFTPEALTRSLGLQRGVEELTIHLNWFYDALIDQQLTSKLGMNALSIRRAISDKWAIAISLNNMGNIALDQGDYESARGQLEEAVALQKEIGDRFYIANGLNNLGIVAREEGNTSQAWDLYRESMEINRDLVAQWPIAFLLKDMGCLAAQSGTPKLALNLIGAASTLRESINARFSELEQKKVDRMLSSARNYITESEASSAWSQGVALILDEAVEYAYNIISLPIDFFS